MHLDATRLDDLLRRALAEDIGPGDVTTDSVVPADATTEAEFVVRQEAVVAGLPVARRLFELLSQDVRFEALEADGARVAADTVIARVSGPARPILRGERVALNFLQRLCGVATVTRRCVDAAEGRAKIMDTRKTTPGLRMLEKYAVRMGGGVNHRLGLYDQVLVKDNHLRIMAHCEGASAVATAVRKARQAVEAGIRIEIEADTPEQALEAAKAGADIVLLDNMDDARVADVVKRIRALGPEGERIEIEISGGVEPDRIAAASKTGADRISLGCLTHSAPAVDISLRFL